MPHNFTVFLALRLISSDVKPICWLFPLSQPYPIQFKQSFWDIVWSFPEFEVTLCQFSCSLCAPMRKRSLMHGSAAPKTQVVIVGVQPHHLAALCKIVKPVWQQSCAQQWLSVNDNLNFNVCKFYKHPFSVRLLDVINI